MRRTFCNFSGDAFLPFGFDYPVLREPQVLGGGFRPSARCPNCGSLDRERLFLLYLNTAHVFGKRCNLLWNASLCGSQTVGYMASFEAGHECAESDGLWFT